MAANRGSIPLPLLPGRRALVLTSALVVASTCSACSTLRPAWKHKAKEDAGAAPLASAQTSESTSPPAVTPEPQSASTSNAYPWANGATLPTAIANAPNPTTRR